MSELRFGRDSYIDSLRGGFHVLMLMDHLPFILPGLFPIVAWIYECLGYVSVAEGFVFLSGYVTGLVYTRIRHEKEDRLVWHKACLRAFHIYACYLAAIIVLVLIVKSGGETTITWGSWSYLFNHRPSIAFMKAAGLLYQPTFLEILPMYSLFLLVAPLIIQQLERGRHLLVIMFSVTLWIADQFDAREKVLNTLFSGHEVSFGVFSSFSWQLLFVSGLICGHRTFVKGPWLPKGWKPALVAYVIVLFFFALRHQLLEIHINEKWFERSSLGLLRLLDFACLAFLVARFRTKIEKIIGWKGLNFLSQHSLQVFAFHLIPIYVAALFIKGTALSWAAQILFISFCILGLFLTAWISRQLKSYVEKQAKRVGN